VYWLLLVLLLIGGNGRDEGVRSIMGETRTTAGDEPPHSDNPASAAVGDSSVVAPLAGQCFNNIFMAEWWSYVWCYGDSLRQIHFNHHSQRIESEHLVGTFIEEESGPTHHIYRSTEADCLNEKTNTYSVRYAEVAIECCVETGKQVPFPEVAAEAGGTIIAAVKEPMPCSYYLTVCSEKICTHQPQPIAATSTTTKASSVSVPSTSSSSSSSTTARTGGAGGKGGPNATPMTFDASSILDHTQAKGKIGQQYQSGERGSSGRRGGDVSVADSTKDTLPIPNEIDQLHARERVREMFFHGYDNYIANAFPRGDLNPLSCTGQNFDLIKIPIVTLIDSLDTLVIMGNNSEFRRAVMLVGEQYPSFELDVNVSVFETTIRVLGGLLSAHMMAMDDSLGIYNETLRVDDHDVFPPTGSTSTSTTPGPAAVTMEEYNQMQQDNFHVYNGWLLVLAKDVGERMLPAFQTNTGIPYGTVNLKHGVPRGETEIASTAGAGSLIVEFEVLSSLTGDRRYGDAAYAATQALYDRRSSIGLLGKHIHTDTGRWFESVSGIGSNSDSFYEYLLKAYLLFRKKEMYGMFSDAYASIKRFVQIGDWFSDVDMFNGKLRRNRVENLHAFWPGMEASLGFSGTGARQLNFFYSVWTSLGYLPEEFDNVEWAKGKNSMHPYYPLRPELIESTYMQYRTTRDRTWLSAGFVFVNSIERTRTSCGFASVNNMDTMELADDMPSFFLSETLKYLYLLFDEENFVHDRAYIFSTEAHPFDPTMLPRVYREEEAEEEEGGDGAPPMSGAATNPNSEGGHDAATTHSNNDHAAKTLLDRDGGGSASAENAGATESTTSSKSEASGPNEMLPVQCSRRLWWDSADSFVYNFMVPSRKDKDINTAKATAVKHPWQIIGNNGAAGGALNMLFNIINNKPDASEEKKVSPDAQEVEQPALSPLHLSQRHTLGQLEKASRAVRQLEMRGQLPSASLDFGGYSSASEHVRVVEGSPSGDAAESASATADSGSTSNPPSPPPPRRARDKSVKRPHTCYAEDSPANVASQPAPPPGSLQTVEVSMGPLGDFTVYVYSDGFIVKSRTDGNALEISNVGQDLMFVRDSNDEGSETVIGDMAGQVVTCSVAVFVGEEMYHHPNGEELFRRSCSIAAFGGSDFPRSLLNYKDAQTKRGPVHGEGVATFSAGTSPQSAGGGVVVTPRSSEQVTSLCGVPSERPEDVPNPESPASTSVTDAASAGEGKSVVDTSANSGGANARRHHQSVFGMISSFFLGANSEDAGSIDDNNLEPPRDPNYDNHDDNGDDDARLHSSEPASSFAGKVAIARRGDCMFEEKAVVAGEQRAEALIVINNENNVFIMSGQRPEDPNARASVDASVAGASSSSTLLPEEAKSVPTVMLSSKDGEDLLTTLRDAKMNYPHLLPGSAEARVTVEVATRDMLLDSSLLGAQEYPKLRMKKNLIHVIGRGRWGCVITSQNGGEWQLFIQRKEDMNTVQIWPTIVPNAHGEYMTITPALGTNPVELYANMVARTCPRGLREASVPEVAIVDGEEAPRAISLTLTDECKSCLTSADGSTIMTKDTRSSNGDPMDEDIQIVDE
jgi:mannosidase alpha-like ER degradation enhancer 2